MTLIIRAALLRLPKWPRALALTAFSCAAALFPATSNSAPMKDHAALEKAIFGGGCFWCTEAVFKLADGVLSVTPGYAGGHTENPTYDEVCTGRTGHAEVVLVEFDPAKISYRRLVDLFWEAHDPTTLNRQGADIGTQYRSIIIALNDEQRREAEASKAAAQPKFSSPIVTEITGPAVFYPAEAYHHDFFRRNPFHPYNRAVVAPKVEKAKKALANAGSAPAE